MNYRQLGSAEMRVSEVGFGCGSTGGLLLLNDHRRLLLQSDLLLGDDLSAAHQQDSVAIPRQS